MDQVAASHATIRKGSKSFAAASVLLDRKARESAWGLYAWCRYCDDVVDGQELGGAMAAVINPDAKLAQLRMLTRRALETEAPVPPEFEMLRSVGRANGLGLSGPMALLDGFDMDVEARAYATLQDTLDYAFHVAGIVGVMMAQVMGVKDRSTLDRACDLGLAFQLTNIARDVMEDARAGRIYLPADWLVAEGVAADPQAVLAPENREAVARVAARLVRTADGYYRSARAGVASLPLRRAWAIAAARDVYRQIGREVLKRGRRAWDGRASTSGLTKLRLLGRGALVAIATRFPLRAASREGLWTMPA